MPDGGSSPDFPNSPNWIPGPPDLARTADTASIPEGLKDAPVVQSRFKAQSLEIVAGQTPTQASNRFKNTLDRMVLGGLHEQGQLWQILGTGTVGYNILAGDLRGAAMGGLLVGIGRVLNKHLQKP